MRKKILNQARQALIKINYSKIDKIMSKWEQGTDLCQEDKVTYYNALSSIRYERWTLRENVSKRNCRKLFEGIYRTVVFDGDIKIKDTKLGRIMNSRELRDKKDEAWESFLREQD